jgi:hypothetical protein
MSNSPPEIGDGRKLMYYGGMVASGIGLLVFLSVFLTFGQNLDPGQGPAMMRSFAVRAVGGMLLMIAGQGVQRMGARGLAGSGVILDPEQARKDVEPWTRMAGGMANDALSEVDLAGRLGGGPAAEPAVKIRCPGCRELNDERAKFCDQCGAAL